MEKKYKIRAKTFIAYIVLQALLSILLLVISSTEGVSHSAYSLPISQSLVSCGPCVLIGLVNIFLLFAYAEKNRKILMITGLTLSLVSLCYYAVWFVLIFVRNMNAMMLRISRASASIDDYVLLISYFGFTIAIIMSTLICYFLFHAYIVKNETLDSID